jgi:hypothetical protein
MLQKGIVSRDWGGLLLGLLERSEAQSISGSHLFLIESSLHIEILTMASVRVLFSPGFFLYRNLPLRGSRTPEEMLSRAPFPREVK